MKNFSIPTLLFLALSFLATTRLPAQCSALENAVQGLSLAASGGTNNRSGLVYNPLANLYYSVNAGSSSYPVDTYNESGSLLASVAQGFDYRGAWWNPALNLFEGNGFNDLGIFVHTLEAGTAYPTGTGTVIFTAAQPNSQSIGALDYDNNEIIYFDQGYIHRYSRNTNQFLGQYLIGDLPLPLTDINNNSVVYTGCAGYEIGIYDYVNRRVLFVNKATGKYSDASQLPGSAPQRSSFGMSYANDLFWLFDAGNWYSYQVVDLSAGASTLPLPYEISLSPNPVSDILHIRVDSPRGAIQADLTTLQGQRINSTPIGASGETDIDMSGLPAGIYLVSLVSDEGITTRKIVKGH